IEEAFLRGGVPYRIVKGLRFYERKEIKDIISYLYTIINPDDNINLLRIINTPPRRIGKQTINKLTSYASANNISLYQALNKCRKIKGINKGTLEKIHGFISMIEELRECVKSNTATEMIEMVIDKSGYKTFLLESGDHKAEERYENIRELMSISILSGDQMLEPFLQELSLMSDMDISDSSEDAVALMTLHAAKGLEFDYVFIAGMEDNILPHANSMYKWENYEEERRLCYVGITRAKKGLFMLYTKSRTLYGNLHVNPPSPYIRDIPEELILFIKNPFNVL
ncbi:MAG: ATP-dependent DNA helicase PcrA, partial [Nitrospirae bacterium]